ncbi:MAG: LexA family transcriptional regulator [Planctomycetota bacterium]
METSFGGLLRGLRRGRELTLNGLAERVGVTPGYLSMIENGRVNNPPSMKVLVRLEAALAVRDGSLCKAAQWEKTPKAIREQLEQARQANTPPDRSPRRAQQGLEDFLGVSVPLINKVAAGYPTGFTDMGYPARASDDVVTIPGYTGLHGGHDPDAFAATVCGDSMQPEYRAGDIVVFSPLADVVDGSDCFARLEPDHECTFKRVFFEADDMIRLQALNPDYPARTVGREQVAGLFRAVWRMSRL